MTEENKAVTAAELDERLYALARKLDAKTEFDNDWQAVMDAIDALAVLRRERDAALREATGLATALHRRWYYEVTQWRPITDSVAGVISQIDNMSAGIGQQLDDTCAAIAKKDAALREIAARRPRSHIHADAWAMADIAEAALAPAAQPSTPRAEYACDHIWRNNADGAYCTRCGLAPAAQGEQKGACPNCGCEEVDHRDLWTCRCPAAPAPSALQHDHEPDPQGGLAGVLRDAGATIRKPAAQGLTPDGEDLLAYARSRAWAAPAPSAGETVLVPRELIDRFPEINPSNYDHDDVYALNAWGCEVVTAAAPTTGETP